MSDNSLSNLPHRVAGTHLPAAFYSSAPGALVGIARVPRAVGPERFDTLTVEKLQQLRDALRRSQLSGGSDNAKL